MYGEQQGNGPNDDKYLIRNLTSHIESGWYDELSSGLFSMLGFELGMIHGGLIDPLTCEYRMSAGLIILTSQQAIVSDASITSLKHRPKSNTPPILG